MRGGKPLAGVPTGRDALPPVAELLPHRAPMLLLDEARQADEQHIECRVVLRRDSPFVAGGRVRATLAIEYMAQCVAAWVGVQDRARGGPIRIGYLIGAREVTFAVDDFHVGDDLRIEATKGWGDQALGHFESAVRRGDDTLATAAPNVYRGDFPLEHP